MGKAVKANNNNLLSVKVIAIFNNRETFGSGNCNAHNTFNKFLQTINKTGRYINYSGAVNIYIIVQ